MSIKSHNIATLPGQSMLPDISFEVNYMKEDENLIKVSIGRIKTIIKKDDLWNMIFTIVEEDKQLKMIPVKKQEMERYIKQHTVRVKKDLKEGEEIFVNCEVNVRKEVADAVRRELEEEGIKSPYLQKLK